MAVLIEKRNRERLNMQQAQQNISNLVVKAPFSGLVAVKDNRDASGGFFTSGMVLPEYRPGDQVSSGRFIAEILEVSTMEILSKVGEGDRGNINPGQPVEVHVDTLAGAAFNGKVKTVAGMASRGDMWGGDGTRKFDATFALDKPDDRLRPGVTAQIIILGEAIKNALFLPRQAIFEREGKPVVYVRKGSSFEPQEIKIAKRNESQVVIEGLPEGTEVALANPEKMKKTPGKGPTAGPSLGGAGGK
ncbi:MAG: efflux RND transporter periplasmic adaptor subunit [Acidobacteria bacterium]|nr:efflux RND transporter periplasmic adaptor subunit [Acidobacteriota bacterium]